MSTETKSKRDLASAAECEAFASFDRTFAGAAAKLGGPLLREP